MGKLLDECYGVGFFLIGRTSITLGMSQEGLPSATVTLSTATLQISPFIALRLVAKVLPISTSSPFSFNIAQV